MIHNISDNDTAINIINEAYKNQPSVTKIKEIIEKDTTKRFFKFDSVAKPYITTLLKNIDIQKSHRCRQNTTEARETIGKYFV